MSQFSELSINNRKKKRQSVVTSRQNVSTSYCVDNVDNTNGRVKIKQLQEKKNHKSATIT